MARTRRRKKRTHLPDSEDPAQKGQPRSFVIRRGRHAAVLKDLEADVRRLLSPNTAAALRESRRNSLRDFVHVAGPLGVTHLALLTATPAASYLRLAALPRGPTLTLRLRSHALCRDVLAAQARPRAPQSMWLTPPLVVMNNFAPGGGGGAGGGGGSKNNSAEHLKLATAMFQGLFPSIDVRTARPSACRRVLLLDRDAGTGRISLRHYSVRVAAAGVSPGVRALLRGARGGRLPDLGGCADAAELLTAGGPGSESEGDDAEAARVVVDRAGAGAGAPPRQSRVRLHEVGPRLEMDVVKVEAGLCGGEVLYHAHESRTPAQAAAQSAAAAAREALREARRREQEENVRRKRELRDAAAPPPGGDGGGRARRGRQWWEARDDAAGGGQEDDDDDDEHYRREVGEDPGDDFAAPPPKRARQQQQRGGGGGARGARGAKGAAKGGAAARARRDERRKGGG